MAKEWTYTKRGAGCYALVNPDGLETGTQFMLRRAAEAAANQRNEDDARRERVITIGDLIGQRVIARSPQTGRQYSGTVIGEAHVGSRRWVGASFTSEDVPVAIIQLDAMGPLMRVFLHDVKLDEEGATWLR